MRASKSIKKVAEMAYEISNAALPPYSHDRSKKTFTQGQLMSCLVLKSYMRLDYRGVSQFLGDFKEIREILELEETPHYTTLQKASKRLIGHTNFKKLVDEILEAFYAKKIPPALMFDLQLLMGLDLKVGL